MKSNNEKCANTQNKHTNTHRNVCMHVLFTCAHTPWHMYALSLCVCIQIDYYNSLEYQPSAIEMLIKAIFHISRYCSKKI